MDAGARPFPRLGLEPMNSARRRFAVAALASALTLAGAAGWWTLRATAGYLGGETARFVALFDAPTAPGSAQTRRELDELLELQRTRSAADVAAARADRKTDVERFFGALGLPGAGAPRLPQLRRLAQRVEDDIRPYTRAAKDHFSRQRPYEIEPRLRPCIDHVRGDLSYPSGHATYGYVIAYLLGDMVPERAPELQRRADEFARQRMVCGVHFRSDIEAGRKAARWLTFVLLGDPGYRRDSIAAALELRAALHLPPRASRPP